MSEVKCTRCYELIPDDQLTHSKPISDHIPGGPYHQDCLQTIRENTQKKAKHEKKQEEHQTTIREEITLALAQKKRAKSTELIRDHILQHNHIYTTRDDDKPEMWYYHEGIYKPNGRTYIKEHVRRLAGTLFTTHLINEVIRKIEADTYVDQDEFFSRHQNYPHLVPVQNGILNINTKELTPYTHKKFFFNKLPITYDPQKDCPEIKKWFSQVMHQDDIPVIQEYTGFTLLREYKYEKSLMLYGEGRNGKGKFLDLLKKILGPQNVSSISLQDIEKDQFAVGELHTKLANIAGDISKAAIKHSGMFKSLTGRDTIQAARKFKTRVTFVNYAKMIFAANEIPRTTDMSPAFFDRWILIEFPNRFLPRQEINQLPEDERENVYEQDPDIIRRITTQDEISGMLNWMLDGYARLRENNGFSDNTTSAEVKEAWIRKSDSFMAFCLDHVREAWDAEVLKSDLRQAYQRFCRENRVKGVSDRVIKTVLAEQYGASDRQTGGTYYWVGIRLEDGEEEEDVVVQERIDLGGVGQGGQVGQGGSTNREFWKFPIEVNRVCYLPTLPKSGVKVVKTIEMLPKILKALRKSGPVPYHEICDNWPGTTHQLDVVLKELQQKGEVFEPKKGYWQTLE